MATKNNVMVGDSGRSANRHVCSKPATSTSNGTRRSLSPLPTTRIQRRGMSMSRTCRASTSADRSPENNINPAIARSRFVRKLPSNAAVSARSSPRGSRRGSAAGTGTSVGPGAPATRPAVRSSTGGPPRSGAPGDQGRIPHRPEIEQTRDRRHPPVDRRRGIPGRPAGPQRHHVPTRLTGQHRGPAERQEPQQRIGCHLADRQFLIDQPPGERQQVERVGPFRPRRVTPISDIPQEIVDHRFPLYRPLDRLCWRTELQ